MTITETGTNSIDSLLSGESWLPSATGSTGTAVTTITYSFMTSNTEGVTGFQAMTTAQQQAAIAALATWASVANIQFKQVASGGEIQFGTADMGTTGSAETDTYYNSSGVFTTNYVYLNNTKNYSDPSYSSFNLDFTAGSYGPSVLIHEIGHALGLKHPGDYGDGTPPPYLYNGQNTRDYSVMSYLDGQATTYFYSAFNGNTYSVTPMQDDIQAIQYLYGANQATNPGDTVYRFSNFSAPSTVWDAGGNNTFDFSACTNKVSIDLNSGAFSSTDYLNGFASKNVSIAVGTLIQTAIAGSGGSIIWCNAAADTIIGGAGDDLIIASTGTLTIDGKGGSNTLMVEDNGASYDLSHDSFTNVQTLNAGGADVTLTIAGYNSFTTYAGGGGVTFTDSGRIVANPTNPYYQLANGSNDLVFTAANTDPTYGYYVLGGTGSNLFDIRGANIGTGKHAAVFSDNGGTGTIDFSGAAGDYVFSLGSDVATAATALLVTDSHSGRDGTLYAYYMTTLQFTDQSIDLDSPLLSFIATQNSTRLSGTQAVFHYGIAGTTTNNVIGEESANLGSGYNAVILSGDRSQYGISVDSAGTLTLTDSGKTYTITGDHYLLFDNAATTASGTYQDIDFILSGSDAQAASLYNAALGRQPDLPGLEFYAVPLAQGTMSLHQAAVYFLASPEFQSRFSAAAKPADDGGVNDQAFITQLYQTVLNRTPSASEMNFYVQDLQGTLPGVAQQDRAQLLVNFALSPENQKDISGWLI